MILAMTLPMQACNQGLWAFYAIVYEKTKSNSFIIAGRREETVGSEQNRAAVQEEW